MSNKDKIVVDHAYKIFGQDPDAVMVLLKQGLGKEEIFERTGQTVAVEDANFSVKEGEIFVVMGLSGSGKSTLVRMINRLIEPTSGRIEIDGRELTAMSRRELTALRREQMAMVFQHFALFPHRTVAENAQFGLKIRGLGRTERARKAQAALDQVGLGSHADSYPRELSGGMQQRVGLARALASDANILLMDEPFSALDPLIRRDMQQELLQLETDSPRTIVFISHDLYEALILGDRIAIMRDGKIIQIGTGEEIVANPADDYVAAFTQDIDRSRVFTAGTVMSEAKTFKQDSIDLKEARELMRAGRLRGAYVVDTDGKPVGMISQRLLGRHGIEAKPEDVMLRAYPQCSADDMLVNIYSLCAKGLPIAVVDEAGRLQGVLDPLDVFAQIAETTEGAASASDKSRQTAA